MSEGNLPAPQVALVVSDQSYRSISNDAQRAHLLAVPDSLIIPFSVTPIAQVARVTAVREQLVARDRLMINQLLVRNPYDAAAYEFADDAIEAFVKAKYYHLANVAALLGASSIKFLKVEIEQNKTDMAGMLRAGLKGVAGDVTFTRSVKNRLEARFEASTALAGKTADVEAARAFMLARRLATDPDVVGLIDLCAAGNPLQSHRVKVDGLRESTRSLKAGLDLTSSLGMKLGAGGNFKRAVESINSIEVTIEIRWPGN